MSREELVRGQEDINNTTSSHDANRFGVPSQLTNHAGLAAAVQNNSNCMLSIYFHLTRFARQLMCSHDLSHGLTHFQCDDEPDTSFVFHGKYD